MRYFPNLATAVVVLAISLTAGVAQNETAPVESDGLLSEIMIEQITRESLLFIDDIDELVTRLENSTAYGDDELPIYLAMIEAVDGLLEMVGPGTPLANSVGNLLTEAETRHELWRAWCWEHGASRVCEREELFYERVVTALEAQVLYAFMLRSIMASQVTIRQMRDLLSRLYISHDGYHSLRASIVDQMTELTTFRPIIATMGHDKLENAIEAANAAINGTINKHEYALENE